MCAVLCFFSQRNVSLQRFHAKIGMSHRIRFRPLLFVCIIQNLSATSAILYGSYSRSINTQPNNCQHEIKWGIAHSHFSCHVFSSAPQVHICKTLRTQSTSTSSTSRGKIISFLAYFIFLWTIVIIWWMNKYDKSSEQRRFYALSNTQHLFYTDSRHISQFTLYFHIYRFHMDG